MDYPYNYTCLGGDSTSRKHLAEEKIEFDKYNFADEQFLFNISYLLSDKQNFI